MQAEFSLLADDKLAPLGKLRQNLRRLTLRQGPAGACSRLNRRAYEDRLHGASVENSGACQEWRRCLPVRHLAMSYERGTSLVLELQLLRAKIIC